MTQTIGIIAGIFTSTSLVPQLIKLFREKKSGDISRAMFIILLIGLLLWVIYGIQEEAWPIIITNAFSFLVNAAILVMDGYYKKHPGGK